MLLLSTLPAGPAWLVAYQHHELALGRGLGILGVWALLNLVASGYQLPRTDRREWLYHFHFMNCLWAFINAILAAVGILRTHPGAPLAGFTAATALADVHSTSQIFLINAGLDVGYLLVGLWLLTHAARPGANRPERLYGYGRSVQLQGGFLLLFDAVMWWFL
ncbi:DUF6992 family protein [Hymenobacter psoromatis]|uniref:DUF6992 family protein n=1 Tax=Hymenobacter psoromatis TaxID=1484116 RepID=UPI001CBE654C|nr:hypothetical protein [Hymenobacter psoromatis]